MVSACASGPHLIGWENYTIKPKEWADESVPFDMSITYKQAKSDAIFLLEQLNSLDLSDQKIRIGESKNIKQESNNALIYDDRYDIDLDYNSCESVFSATFKKENIDNNTKETTNDVYRFRQTVSYTHSNDAEYTLIECENLNDFSDNSYSAIIKVDDSNSEKIDSNCSKKKDKICNVSWISDILNKIINNTFDNGESTITYSHTYSRNYKKGDEYAVIFTVNITKNTNDKTQAIEELYSLCPAVNLYQLLKTTKYSMKNDTDVNIDVVDVYQKYFMYSKQSSDIKMSEDKEELLKQYSTANEIEYDLPDYPYLANYGEETYSHKVASYFNLL